MATRGRNICNTLKAIRKQIADANGIEYSPEECHFKGECKGTCPKCEQDVKDLEYELRLREMAGKAIKIAGVALGITTMTACSDGKPQRSTSDIVAGEDSIAVKIDPQLSGDTSSTHEEEVIRLRIFPNKLPKKTSKLSKQGENTEQDNKHNKKTEQDEVAFTQPAIAADSTENSKLFGEAAEETASFPGGSAALMKYIADNIRAPKECLEGAVSGRVILGFTVNEDGSLSDIKVMRSVVPELDEEAIRVVKSMPKWNPAKQNGKAVKSKYTVPVVFRWK